MPVKTDKEVQTKYFFQGDKSAMIMNKKGTKIIAKAKKGIFHVSTKKISVLLTQKGYKEIT